MNWRLASRLSVITLAILVTIAIILIQNNRDAASSINGTLSSTSASGIPGLQGTTLGGTPAPNFTLTDQYGKQVSLSQFKGEPTVLTFMYTHCPDECPLTTAKLHTVMQSLGSQAHHVAVLVVSTDPKGDTEQAALNFSKAHQMQNYWYYLVGTQQTLSPVWSSYNTYVQSNNGAVSHGLGLYILDKQGREQLFLNNNFTPAQVTADLKTLLKA